MRTCETIYGPDQADAIEALVVAATGRECPCRRDAACPLLDAHGRNPLAEIIPRSA